MASNTQKSGAKKTAAKAATKKQVEKEVVVENVVEEPVVVEKRTYKDDDFIQCRSISVSEILFFGVKSGATYRFSGKDDTYGVEVKDLNSLLASKSNILFKPYIIIEDEDFIAQPRWKELKDMYDAARAADISELIDLPVNRFKEILVSLPNGYKELLVNEISTRLQNGTFDSLNKIKAVDEVCNTELMLLAQ